MGSRGEMPRMSKYDRERRRVSGNRTGEATVEDVSKMGAAEQGSPGRNSADVDQRKPGALCGSFRNRGAP